MPQEHGLHLDTEWFELRRPTTSRCASPATGRSPSRRCTTRSTDLTARRPTPTSCLERAETFVHLDVAHRGLGTSPAARTPTTAHAARHHLPLQLDPHRLTHPSVSGPSECRETGRRTPSTPMAANTRMSHPFRTIGRMPITVTHPAHGAPALDALAAAVRAAKGGDPLAPVAVIVPTNTAGVMARRALGRRGGAAAIDVLTLYRVAELLGAPSLHAEGRKPGVDAGRRPRRQAGHPRHPGPLRRRQPPPVDRRRPARPVPRAARRRRRRRSPRWPAPPAAASRRGSPPRSPGCLAREWYDEGDLLARAAERAPPTTCRTASRRVVVHLPQRLRPLEHRAARRARASAATSSCVLGLTGDADADAAVVGPRRGRSPAHPLPAGAPAARRRRPVASRSCRPPTPTTRSASPCAPCVDAARAGTRFDRIAVLFPTDRPYARLVEHQLDRRRHPVERPAGHDGRRADGAAGARRAARARPPRPAPQRR